MVRDVSRLQLHGDVVGRRVVFFGLRGRPLREQPLDAGYIDGGDGLAAADAVPGFLRRLRGFRCLRRFGLLGFGLFEEFVH